MKKIIFLGLFLGIVLTGLILNSPHSYINGVPVLIYSLLPLGMLFLIVEAYLYVNLFVFLSLWVGKFKRKYAYWVLLVAVYFSLNMLAAKFTNLELPSIVPIF